MRHRRAAVSVLAVTVAVSLTACAPGAATSAKGSGGFASAVNDAASAAHSAIASASSAAGRATSRGQQTGGLGSVPDNAGSGLPYSNTANNSSVQTFPAAGSCHYVVINAVAGEYLPDTACDSGALNPAVTQANIHSTICRSGYTKSIRPAVRITDREKELSAAAYSFTGSFKTAELDHIVSLELGGASNAARNLYVEPNRSGARSTTNPKDSVENALHDAVCAGTTSLAAAQHAIASDWATALPSLGLPQVKALTGAAGAGGN